jgi:hypothetical protein
VALEHVLDGFVATPLGDGTFAEKMESGTIAV